MKTRLPHHLMAALLSVVFTTELVAQPTTVTYQGRFTDNGVPATGLYDFTFELYNAETNGDSFGVITNTAVAVSSGLFTVTLDFGPDVLNGDERWLEIGATTNGGGGITTLSPRQQIVSTPYALKALEAAAVPMGTITSNMLATGAVGSEQLAAGTVFNGTFVGDGNSLSNLDSAKVTGTLTVNPLGNIGHIYNGGTAYGIAVAGNYAFLANLSDGLRVYDISNPAFPTNIWHTNNGGFAIDVAVSENYLYLANATDGLRVYDVSDPTNPVNVGHTNDGGSSSMEAVGVAVQGDYAFLATEADGLRVYDVSNPTNVVSIGHIYDGEQALDVAVQGDYAYLANNDDGLRVYDISNPTTPVSIGHYNDVGQALGVAVSGSYACLANGSDGLRVYDISNPTNPISIGHIDDGGTARRVAMRGSYAYLANDSDGLRLYDLNNPQAPVNIGHVDDGGLARNVAISGPNAYLANSGDGLRVYDAGTVSAPSFAGTFIGSFFGDGNGLTGVHSLDSSDGSPTDALFVDSDGRVGIGTTAPTNQLHVIGGVSATAFVSSSDRNAKQNFKPVSSLDILNKVTALPVTTWNFRDLKDGRHLGPMAQDFYAAFGLGLDDQHIATIDADGVALAAIQGLNEKMESGNRKAETEIKTLKAENAALRQELQEIKQLLSKLTKKGVNP